MVRTAFPILYVADVRRALAFYRDRLGGRVTYVWPPEEEPNFTVVGFEEGAVGLTDADVAHELIGLDLGQLPNGEICMYVDDVDSLVQEMHATGVRIVREPADMPWGERMAYIADPDGNLVQLTAPTNSQHD